MISPPCSSETTLRLRGVLKKYHVTTSAFSRPSLTNLRCTHRSVPRATACSNPCRNRSSGGRGSPLRLRLRNKRRSACNSRSLIQRGLPCFCASNQKMCNVTFNSALSSISGSTSVKKTSGIGTYGFFPDGNPVKVVIGVLHLPFRAPIIPPTMSLPDHESVSGSPEKRDSPHQQAHCDVSPR